MAWAATTNKNTANSGTGATSISTGAAPAAFNANERVVVSVSSNAFTTANATFSVTDSLGNTYAEDSFATVSTNTRFSTFSANVTVTGTPTFVRATLSGGNGDISIAWVVYTGLATSSAKDVAVTTAGTAVQAVSAATGATGAANELVVGSYGDDGWNNLATGKNGTGFTERVLGAASSLAQVYLEDKDSGSSATTQTASMATGFPGGANWGMGAVVYKLAGVAADPFPAGYYEPKIERNPLLRM